MKQKQSLLYLFVLVFYSNLTVSREHRTYMNIPTNDTNKIKVFELWEKYLNANTCLDTFWSNMDRDKFEGIDILKTSLGLGGSLYKINFDCNVLGIYNLGDNYVIKSALYWLNKNNSNNPITLLAIINVLVVEENNTYKLSNYINYSTSNWVSKRVGRIHYHYPIEYPFNVTKALSANAFLDSISMWFLIPKSDTLDYYIPLNCIDGQKMVGFEYFEGQAKKLNLCGYFDHINNIVYSNAYNGEFYTHELVHLINKHYPHANKYLLTGLAAYINDEGSLGESEKKHLKRFMQLFPNQNLNKFYDINYINDSIVPHYLFGSVICHSLMRKGGLHLILETLKRKLSDAELVEYLLDIFDYNSMGDFFENEFKYFLEENILLTTDS